MGILDSDNARLSKAYKEHICFKELDEAKKFYECVSDRAFCFLPSEGLKALQIMKLMSLCPFMVPLILLKNCC